MIGYHELIKELSKARKEYKSRFAYKLSFKSNKQSFDKGFSEAFEVIMKLWKKEIDYTISKSREVKE